METFTEMSSIFENCTSNCTDDNYDLYPHSYIIATIYLFTSILGILGNSLVIIGVIVTPKLQTPTNVLIVNLAIADLLTCMILPFQVYGILHEAIGAKFPRVCSFIGSVIYVTFTCSAVTLVLIAINRCYVITKNVHTTTGLNTHKKQLFLAVLSWILACLYNFIPIYGFHLTEFSYYPPYKQCFTSPTDTSDIYHNFLAILIGCHIVIMLGCYIRILVHVRQQRKLFHIFFGSSRSQQLEHRHHIKRLSQREVKVTKNLFSVVVAFICCTIPTAVAFVTPGVLLSGLYTTAVLYFNNCINPVFYAFRHPVFKKFFERLFMRVLKNFHCPKKLIPAGDSRYLAKTQEKSVTMACLYAVNVSQIVALQGVSDSIEMLDML
ncbi:melatonin receptor type 1B-B-like [Lytechinus variegatus]|uniref:melatonin receptor type 1B-B-like n=1 Tax=Lytechinus variegatus TaxID=7654 RepID=UPI001BB1C22D|nr:melatonin receptor type 1B-B-like [Lytechinus variegatus]XP_041476780.1 melatonin receptor type 1B-B-like [Lytechinus variegatus]XP_041476781.1 melatonin receptor type 1B-B-like [Lytechinus variegatus]